MREEEIANEALLAMFLSGQLECMASNSYEKDARNGMTEGAIPYASSAALQGEELYMVWIRQAKKAHRWCGAKK